MSKKHPDYYGVNTLVTRGKLQRDRFEARCLSASDLVLRVARHIVAGEATSSATEADGCAESSPGNITLILPWDKTGRRPSLAEVLRPILDEVDFGTRQAVAKAGGIIPWAKLQPGYAQACEVERLKASPRN